MNTPTNPALTAAVSALTLAIVTARRGGYETAPATLLVATHCACCARPLVDAVSVERGCGPDCSRRYGIADAQGPADALTALACLYRAVTENPALVEAADSCRRTHSSQQRKR